MSNPIRSVSREIVALRRSLKAADRSLLRLGPMLREIAIAGRLPSAAPVRRKLNLSPQRRAQLKVQGKYMATIRQLRPKQKAEVRGVLQRKGMPAAIARAERLMNQARAA